MTKGKNFAIMIIIYTHIKVNVTYKLIPKDMMCLTNEHVHAFTKIRIIVSVSGINVKVNS